MQGPPYFDWRLDRWKIGLALLLWIGLLVYSPSQWTLPDPQGASPIARPGQRPVVGASSQTGIAPTVAEESAQPTANAVPATASPLPTPAAESSILSADLSQLMILESGQGPLTNNTPLFYGQTVADGLVEILVEGRRYAVLADGDGYWQFSPSSPLPVGMTWVQALGVDASGAAMSETASQMALVGPSAQAVSPPVILSPLPSAGKMENSTPYFLGSGPAGRRLVIFAQTLTGLSAAGLSGANGPPAGEAVGEVVGEVVVSADGGWGWQMAAPLPAGRTTLWAVVVDEEGVPLSRSWPVTLDVTDNAVPSADVSATR